MPIDVGHKFATKPKANARVWDPLPEDMYQVEVLDVAAEVDETPYGGGDPKDVINVSFVILDNNTFEGDIHGEQSTRGRRLWLRVNPNMSPPGDYPASKIYQIASNCFGGKIFSKHECERFDYNSIIGRQLRVGVKTKTSKNTGKEYNQINSFFKPGKPLPPFDPETEGFKKKEEEAPF